MPSIIREKENKSALEMEISNHKDKANLRKNKGSPAKITNLVKDYSDAKFEEPKGHPTAVCKTCGKTFNQDFSEERNAYSSWRTCSECRKKRAKKKEKQIDTKREREVAVATLPYEPYPWQVEAEEAFEKHRFVVLACGNRSGYRALCIK